jgi:hypothetical protein
VPAAAAAGDPPPPRPAAPARPARTAAWMSAIERAGAKASTSARLQPGPVHAVAGVDQPRHHGAARKRAAPVHAPERAPRAPPRARPRPRCGPRARPAPWARGRAGSMVTDRPADQQRAVRVALGCLRGRAWPSTHHAGRAVPQRAAVEAAFQQLVAAHLAPPPGRCPRGPRSSRRAAEAARPSIASGGSFV